MAAAPRKTSCPRCAGCIDATIHNVEGMAWFVLLAFAVGRAAGLLARPAVRRWLDRLTATVFIGFGVKLASRAYAGAKSVLAPADGEADAEPHHREPRRAADQVEPAPSVCAVGGVAAREAPFSRDLVCGQSDLTCGTMRAGGETPLCYST
jgi:LysE type translocator